MGLGFWVRAGVRVGVRLRVRVRVGVRVRVVVGVKVRGSECNQDSGSGLRFGLA